MAEGRYSPGDPLVMPGKGAAGFSTSEPGAVAGATIGTEKTAAGFPRWPMAAGGPCRGAVGRTVPGKFTDGSPCAGGTTCPDLPGELPAAPCCCSCFASNFSKSDLTAAACARNAARISQHSSYHIRDA